MRGLLRGRDGTFDNDIGGGSGDSSAVEYMKRVYADDSGQDETMRCDSTIS